MRPAAITRDTATAQPERRLAGAVAPGAPLAALLTTLSVALPGALATAWLGTASAQGTGIAYPIQPPVLLPGVRASAAYSDNVLLSDSNKKGDMIIEVSPYIPAQSNAPRANYSLF
ncbi:MAG: hypothetical protein IT508_04340, partial [Burkholderiaceae bacterium]|nr:hypothetical protein [Burkholderiaceae bacterium]